MRSFLIFLFIPFLSISQDSRTEVLSLGVFHFDFPNNDVVQVDSSEQIDVLKREYQDEIEDLVKKLKEFTLR